MSALRLGLGLGLPQSSGGASSLAPAITDFVIKDITDVAMTIEANVNPNGDSTAVSIFNGATEIPLADIPAGNSPVLISYTITGLLPYTNYSIHIEAVNTVGSDSTATLTRNTLEPLELTDGNWFAKWDANYEKNEFFVASTGLAVIADTQYDCILGDELLQNTEFDNSDGITLPVGMTITDGKLEINVSVDCEAYQTAPVGYPLAWYRVEALDNIITSGDIYLNAGSAANKSQGRPVASTSLLITGSYSKNHFGGADSLFRIRARNTPAVGQIENVSCKQISGRHLFSNREVDDKVPTKAPENDYISYVLSEDYYSHSFLNGLNIGTIYGIIKRDNAIAVDEDFVLVNTLSGIGTIEETKLVIGTINVDIKQLNIRTVTDDASTIAKLNEWFLRESHELPETPGILTTGVWNDDAVDNDNAIFKDSPE